MSTSAPEWVFPWALTDLDFYTRALEINPQGNNMHKGASGYRHTGAFSESHGLTSPLRAEHSHTYPSDVCSLLNRKHRGEVKERYYMTRKGEILGQALCEGCAGGHWMLERPTFDDASALRKRNTPGEGFSGDYS